MDREVGAPRVWERRRVSYAVQAVQNIISIVSSLLAAIGERNAVSLKFVRIVNSITDHSG